MSSATIGTDGKVSILGDRTALEKYEDMVVV